MRTTLIYTLAIATAAALPAQAACSFGGDPDADASPAEEIVGEVSWTMWSDTDGTELPITIDIGSACDTFESITVDETADTVTITAIETARPDVACNTEYVQEFATVTLEAPLGDRTLLGCRPTQPGFDCRS